MITTVAFDADDTLWHNETFFQLTQTRFEGLLAPWCPADTLHTRLLEAERANLGRYGYGVKGFTLSMIETALEVSQGQVSGTVIAELIAAGKEMLAHPIDLLPGVREVLTELAQSHRLIVVTKGDLLDQDRKVAQSGLGDFFDAVHIVSEKDRATYEGIFATPAQTLMVGNSLKSDVIPALEAGAWTAHIPHDLTWALEQAEPPKHPQFERLNAITEVPDFLSRIR